MISINWGDYLQDCQSLCLQIRSSKAFSLQKDNSIVIGIGRGGFIPATIASYYFDLPLHTISFSSYSDDEKSKTHKLRQIGNPTLTLADARSTKMNFLVIDDIYDTGETFERTREYLKRFIYDCQAIAPETTYATILATLYTKERHVPDLDKDLDLHHLFVKSYANDDWIEFPYETDARLANG